MYAPSRVNKENFRLLDLSSDEESDDLQLEVIPSRKKKITRRERSRGSMTHVPEPNIGAEVQCALRWAVRGTLILWLIMLTWICAALYDQVSTMRLEVSQVTTSSAGVDDALQICHATAKEMRANTTTLKDQIDKLEAEHKDLIMKVNNAVKTLSEVSAQLSAAPKLADTPRRLAELQRTVADFGSQINGFDGALSSAKKQAVTASQGVEEVKTLLHQLDAKTNDTISNMTATAKQEEDIKATLSALNTTILDKVEALRTRIEEISAVRNKAESPAAVVPAVTSSTAQPAATPSVPATTTTVPPGPPAKPSVTQ